MKKNKHTLEVFEMMHCFLCDYLPMKADMSPKTIRTYKAALNGFRKYLSEEKHICFTEIDFKCFDQNTIYDFLIYLRDCKKEAPNTLNNRLAVLRTFLKFCSEEDISLTVYYINAQKIKRFKGEKKTNVEYLTEPQLKSLFSIPDMDTPIGRRNRFMMIFLYETGARIEELLHIRLCDFINTTGKMQLRIYGKGRKTRYIPILEDTKKHLQAYLNEFHKNSNEDVLLFFTNHNNCHTPMTAANVDCMLKKYAKMIAMEQPDFPLKLHAHMFRHSVAMAMYKKGIPLSYIKDFLGHESLETVKIYAYADAETIADSLEKVSHTSDLQLTVDKNWKGKEHELLKYCGLL